MASECDNLLARYFLCANKQKIGLHSQEAKEPKERPFFAVVSDQLGGSQACQKSLKRYQGKHAMK